MAKASYVGGFPGEQTDRGGGESEILLAKSSVEVKEIHRVKREFPAGKIVEQANIYVTHITNNMYRGGIK